VRRVSLRSDRTERQLLARSHSAQQSAKRQLDRRVDDATPAPAPDGGELAHENRRLQSRSVTRELRIGAGRSIVTNAPPIWRAVETAQFPPDFPALNRGPLP
jgi:hypothetical protein